MVKSFYFWFTATGNVRKQRKKEKALQEVRVETGQPGLLSLSQNLRSHKEESESAGYVQVTTLAINLLGTHH